MDSTEAQLRFGSALSDRTDPSHPSHPLHTNYVRSLRERATREEQRMMQILDNRRRTRLGVTSMSAKSSVMCNYNFCFSNNY